MSDWTTFAGTIISALVTLAVCIITQRSSQKKVEALIEYRLTELEKKVDKHNNLIDRTYKLEADAKLLDQRVDELEKKA